MTNYFNKLALLHIISIVIAYTIISLNFINHENRLDVSAALYFQVILISIYSILRTPAKIFVEHELKNFKLVADSLWIILGIWFALVDIYSFSDKPSYISALILTVSFITTLRIYLSFIRQLGDNEIRTWNSKVTILFFQAIILCQLGLFLLIIFEGEWNWNFYDPFSFIKTI